MPARSLTRLYCLAAFIGLGIVSIFGLHYLSSEDYRSHPIPRMNCINYVPFFHLDHFDPLHADQKIKPEWVRGDLEILSKYTSCVRIYSSLYGLDIVPAIAREFHMDVIAGANIYETFESEKTKR